MTLTFNTQERWETASLFKGSNMKTEKTLYISITTTGTERLAHGVTQIALIVEVDGKVTGKFNKYCRPFKAKFVDPDYMKIQKFTEKQVRSKEKPIPAHRLSPKGMYRDLIQFLEQHVDKFDAEDKLALVGYKVDFDLDFLYQFFTDNKDTYLGSFIDLQPVCVLNMVRLLRYSGDPVLDSAMKNCRLAAVCDALGVDLDHSHDAEEKVEAIRILFRKCITRINSRVQP